MFEQQIEAAKHVLAYLEKKIEKLDHNYLDRNYISIVAKIYENGGIPDIAIKVLQAVPDEPKLTSQVFLPHYLYNGVDANTVNDEWLDSHFTRNVEYLLAGLMNHAIGLQHNTAAIITVLED
jgi:hypothetical protein